MAVVHASCPPLVLTLVCDRCLPPSRASKCSCESAPPPPPPLDPHRVPLLAHRSDANVGSLLDAAPGLVESLEPLQKAVAQVTPDS